MEVVYGVIYCITCLLNGMKYVGQTKRSVEQRFSEHANAKNYLGNAIRKYGRENFKIEILEECETPEQLNEREIFWIAYFNCMAPNGYNRTGGGEGHIITPEMISKRSENTTRIWASRTPEERSEIAKRREISMTSEEKSERAKKAAATRNLNVETHAKMSKAQRADSPFKNLLSEIDRLNFSYSSLAKVMGKASTHISRKMNGERNFTAEDLIKLSEIFGKPAEYLMKRDDGLIVKLADHSEAVRKGRANMSSEARAKMKRKMSVMRRSESPFKNLLSEIDKHQLSYTALGEFLNLSQTSVSHKMRGEYEFTAEQINKLVEIFGKPADYLMMRTDGLPAKLSEAEKSANSSKARRSESSYKNLLCEIDKKNLSYKELGKILGLKTTSISNKMRGKVKFTENDIAKLVEIFGKPADYLMKRDE